VPKGSVESKDGFGFGAEAWVNFKPSTLIGAAVVKLRTAIAMAGRCKYRNESVAVTRRTDLRAYTAKAADCQ